MAIKKGTVAGALFVVLIEESLSLITHEWKLIFGPLLVLIVLYAKGGLASLLPKSGGQP